MDLGLYDLKAQGGMRAPQMVECKKCKKLYRYWAMTMITYANRKKVIEDLCDDCIAAKEREGKVKLRELEDKLYGRSMSKKTMRSVDDDSEDVS